MVDAIYEYQNWHEVINTYFQSLNKDGGASEWYRYDVLNSFLKLFLIEATKQKTEKDNDEFLGKTVKRLDKLSIPSRNLKSAKDSHVVLDEIYTNFINKGLVTPADDEIKKIQLATFGYIWIRRTLMVLKDTVAASHVAKLSHSLSTSTSFIDSISETKPTSLSTSSIRKPLLDGTYPDAFFSKEAKFLLLEFKGELLYNKLLAKDVEPLESFTQSKQELVEWANQFSNILTISIKSDALMKQVYFPITKDSYHLLSILKSSSLIQEIYNKCFSSETRSQSKNKKFSVKTRSIYPNIRKILPVLSQPQNVSVLNGARGGSIRLFSAIPPHWQSQLKPPVHKSSLFYDNRIYTQTRDDIDRLKSMLLTFDKAGISCWEPNRLRGIENWVKAIADDILDYASLIHTLDSGWSSDEANKLKLEHCYFLDPYRQDVAFKQSLIAGEWQAIVCQDFANWLNYRLAFDKQIAISDKHTKTWVRVFEPILRHYFDGLMLTSEVQ